ncbi:M23 family metallopeptidase [Cryobacterium algoritolerans]|uniref:M23 family metallopeptidase n=2 Tax=Cryobacterium algoritolerans TaxID=1259184 RepID=A0A4V3IE22_9MICO|nr:M23 family metallopeptidase [Cryobacterium algoritolerans]
MPPLRPPARQHLAGSSLHDRGSSGHGRRDLSPVRGRLRAPSAMAAIALLAVTASRPAMAVSVETAGGTPVCAATGGTVVYAGYKGSSGNWILIDHGNGVSTASAHARGITLG